MRFDEVMAGMISTTIVDVVCDPDKRWMQISLSNGTTVHFENPRVAYNEGRVQCTARRSALSLVRQIAKLTRDGEADIVGQPFVMENDDAYETLDSLIHQARDVLGLPSFVAPSEEVEK